MIDQEVAKHCGEPFARRIESARRNEQESRDLLLEEIASRYRNIRSPRSRLRWAAQAWLAHRWGTL